VAVDGTNNTKITDNVAWETSVDWSADGSHLAYITDDDELFVVAADGTNNTKIANKVSGEFEWSPR